MSHVATLKMADGQPWTVANVEMLRHALTRFCPNLELVEQNTYRTWKADYGRLARDYPVPEGMTEAEVGENATWVIRVSDDYLRSQGRSRNRAIPSCLPYEIGLVRQPDGSFLPVVDFYNCANGLFAVPELTNNGRVGTNLEPVARLSMYYNTETQIQAAEQAQLPWDMQTLEDGSQLLSIETGEGGGW